MPKPVHANPIHPLLSASRWVRWREAFKAGVGRVLGALFPARLEAVDRNPLQHHSSVAERLMRAHLVHKAITSGDHRTLSRYHRANWHRQDGEQFFANTKDRFERWFLGAHRELPDALEVLIIAAEHAYLNFYEIGCGAGQVLEYLAGRIARVEHFIGIDLNEPQIQKNRQRAHDPRVEWVAGSALEWLSEHGRGPAVYFSNAGVLEYFSPEDLSRLFDHATSVEGPVIWALIEPIDPRSDLEQAASSRVFGGELTFSHNYPRLFATHGFQIRFRAERDTEGDRILLLIATKP